MRGTLVTIPLAMFLALALAGACGGPQGGGGGGHDGGGGGDEPADGGAGSAGSGASGGTGNTSGGESASSASSASSAAATTPAATSVVPAVTHERVRQQAELVRVEPPDADEDGILYPTDLCPHDPEDVDGDRDEDGCPDRSLADAPIAQ